MIMELPRFYRKGFAEVINGELFIYKRKDFRILMRDLTYACKKKKCVYCHTNLNRKKRTVDHRYPKSLGEVTIVNNLFPTCLDCNGFKGNMNHEEFLKYRVLSNKERENYIEEIESSNELYKRTIGYKLPESWIQYCNVDEIRYSPSKILRGKGYTKKLEFYNEYNNISSPVITDKNYNVLDGLNSLILAKDMNIKKVATVWLENVISLVD